jgi:hypothetical protein
VANQLRAHLSTTLPARGRPLAGIESAISRRFLTRFTTAQGRHRLGVGYPHG